MMTAGMKENKRTTMRMMVKRESTNLRRTMMMMMRTMRTMMMMMTKGTKNVAPIGKTKRNWKLELGR